MKIIIACDSFKGSLSAYQVGKSLGTGIRKICPDAQILELPMADGGEGTVDAFLNIIKGRRHKSTVMDPIDEVNELSVDMKEIVPKAKWFQTYFLNHTTRSSFFQVQIFPICSLIARIFRTVELPERVTCSASAYR